MDVQELIWENWSLWTTGGLDEARIEKYLHLRELERLQEWAGQEEYCNDYTEEGKRLIDLASWCLYGTHSLCLLSAKFRIPVLLIYAQHFGVSSDHLVRLILSSDHRFLS